MAAQWNGGKQAARVWPPRHNISPGWKALWAGDQLAKHTLCHGTLVATEEGYEKEHREIGWITGMGAEIAYREGNAPINARTHRDVQGDTESVVPEMMSSWKACNENPKTCRWSS